MSITFDLCAVRGSFQLQVEAGIPSRGITAIFGHSGCGKTTLLRCLSGLQPCRGSINISGIDIACLPPRERQMGYVFQEDRLFPHLSVQGNLDFAYQRRFNDHGPSIDQVSQWLSLGQLLQHHPEQLSGGQKKRVAIGRALLCSPRCLLLDEPLAGLDASASHEILHQLKRLSAQLAIPVLYVSHQMDEIIRIADQLLLMEQGQLIANGPLLDLLTRLDLSLSKAEQSAASLCGQVAGHEPKHGMSTLDIGGGNTLWLTRATSAVGETLRVRIPARDVSLTLSKSADTSILNILPATISGIELVNTSRAVVKAEITGSGQCILARITQKSLQHLGLQVGKPVYLQIKSVALLSEKL